MQLLMKIIVVTGDVRRAAGWGRSEWWQRAKKSKKKQTRHKNSGRAPAPPTLTGVYIYIYIYMYIYPSRLRRLRRFIA